MSNSHTHRVVFTTGDVTSIQCLELAMAGRTTKSIAAELSLSESVVQYRIQKGQNVLGVKVRAEFRNGRSEEAHIAMRAIRKHARRKIAEQIAPAIGTAKKAETPKVNKA